MFEWDNSVETTPYDKDQKEKNEEKRVKIHIREKKKFSKIACE